MGRMIRRLIKTDALPKALFAVSAAVLIFGYGAVADHYRLFPFRLIVEAKAALLELTERPWYLGDSEESQPVRVLAADAIAPGLTMINGMALDGTTLLTVVDANGRTIHSWRLSWANLWPHPTHVAAADIPTPPVVHGVLLMPNGDVVLNFDAVGMLRVNQCGKVVWRLPYRTHHSLSLDDQGNIWAPGLVWRREKVARFPNYEPPFSDYTIVEVSPDGRIVRELSVLDVLLQNGLTGLLHMSTLDERSTVVSGDTLHLNDVEIFPSSLTPGVFEAGDVMISLRNINTILVFDPSTLRIKFMTVGHVLRQHDPDFVDGNTISVFDDNNLADWTDGKPDPAGNYSRIIAISAKDESVTVRYQGTKDHPFFTDVLGDHQRLPNGNVLITESMPGRVFEVDADGRIVWEYFNILRPGVVGLVANAVRLPPQFDSSFFSRASAACNAGGQFVRH
jgi:arylsulfotransferase ASST